MAKFTFNPDRRSILVLAWAAAPVLALGLFVQVRGVGIDLLMVALIGLLLLALERLFGSLLSDRIGPFATGAIFAALIVGLSWFTLSSETGRQRTERFFADAELRGYRTLFFKNPRAEESARRQANEPPRQQPPPPATQAVASVPSADNTPVASNSNPVAAPADAESPSWVRRRIRSLFSRSPEKKTPTSVTASASPSSVEVARQVVLSAQVSARNEPVTQGTVEFMVNGRGAGRVFLDGRGYASATYIPSFAGSYEVRVRYAGSAEFDSSVATATFTVR